MILNTWLHIKLLYGLDNVFALQNLQIPSFKFSQVVFVPFWNLFWCVLNVNLCHQQLCKITPFTYDLGSIWNSGATWKSYAYYHVLIQKMRNLITSLKSPHTGTWTQNDLQLVFNNFKLLDILRDMLNIYFTHLPKISALLMIITKSYHFQKKLTSKLRLKTLDTWISINTYPNDMNFFSHI
jgi:hypothetical protein